MKNGNRWKQRFANFEKAYTQFKSAILREESEDLLIRAGLIQTFEFTFELAWRTMKDKLDFEGVTMKSPRNVIEEAYKLNYIEDAKTWIEALDKRNELSHLYDETLTKKAEDLIKNRYSKILEDLYQYLKKSI